MRAPPAAPARPAPPPSPRRHQETATSSSVTLRPSVLQESDNQSRPRCAMHLSALDTLRGKNEPLGPSRSQARVDTLAVAGEGTWNGLGVALESIWRLADAETR